MSGLLVGRDGRFFGMKITAVLDSGPGKPLFIAFRAQRAEWFAPDDRVADPDGWVRDLDEGSISGELALHYTDPDKHRAAVAQALAWQADPPARLNGVASLQDQFLGMGDLDTAVAIGIRMSDDAQDRP